MERQMWIHKIQNNERSFQTAENGLSLVSYAPNHRVIRYPRGISHAGIFAFT